jgi:SH3-like domain-containing protein
VVAADHPQGGSITSYSGFVPEADLWGVYQGEKFD